MRLFWSSIFLLILLISTAYCFEISLISADHRSDGSHLFDVWYELYGLETDEPRILCYNGKYHIKWNFGEVNPDGITEFSVFEDF